MRDGGGTECSGEAMAPMRSAGSAEKVYLLSYSFNQDFSRFVCGTTAGFRVFTVSPVSEVVRRERTAEFQHQSSVLVSMLNQTEMYAMVTVSAEDPARGGSNKVQVWNELATKFVWEIRARTEVKGIAWRRDIIAVVCEYAVYVYDFLDKLRIIQHLTTNANPNGLCVLASASEPWILCCPGQSMGAVRVQVGQDERATHVIKAHESPVVALALNSSGSLIATASEKGTVVKVFQRSDGQLLYRLRRSALPASIQCLTFRHDDRFLAASSTSATVHIFKLDAATARLQGERSGEMSPSTNASPGLGPAPDPHEIPSRSDSFSESFRGPPNVEQIATKLQSVALHLASQAAAVPVVKGVMPSYFVDLRSFAQFRIPEVDSNRQPTVDARSKDARIFGAQLAFHKTEPRLFVLHYSGMLYECSFRLDHDPSLGAQECGFIGATTWFATRPDFKLQGAHAQVQTDLDGGEWQLL